MTTYPLVGFVGASGLMGHGMATNLVTKGVPLSYTVHRREPDGLAEAGATRVDSYAELGRRCQVVFVCVTTADDVTEVLTGPEGLLTDPAEGLIVVDSSTSEPSVTVRLGELAAARGVRLVDAPLGRTPKEAEAGRLNCMIGGDPDAVAVVRPLVELFAENILPTGPLGSAHTVKLLNNFVVQAQVAAMAEAFAVAARRGIDPGLLVEILSMGPAANQIVSIIGNTLDGDFDGMVFALDNARKDVRYFTRLAGDAGHPTPVGDGVHEALGLACALGYGQEFVPSIVRAAEHLAGTPIRRG